jgi:hypothetical protein
MTETTAYKLLRVRADGTIGPLFINARMRVPVGVWLPAEDHPTPGYAHRPGWHCTLAPFAPHLSERGRVWFEVQVRHYRKFNRPQSQGGTWVLAEEIRLVRQLTDADVAALRGVSE